MFYYTCILLAWFGVCSWILLPTPCSPPPNPLSFLLLPQPNTPRLISTTRDQGAIAWILTQRTAHQLLTQRLRTATHGGPTATLQALHRALLQAYAACTTSGGGVGDSMLLSSSSLSRALASAAVATGVSRATSWSTVHTTKPTTAPNTKPTTAPKQQAALLLELLWSIEQGVAAAGGSGWACGGRCVVDASVQQFFTANNKVWGMCRMCVGCVGCVYDV